MMDDTKDKDGRLSAADAAATASPVLRTEPSSTGSLGPGGRVPHGAGAAASFTKGPWRLRGFEVWAVTDGNPGTVLREQIADVYEETHGYLIAAAPDLYEAGAKVLAWWDEKLANELSSNRDFAWAEDAEWSEFQSLRRALSLARGES